MPVQKRFPLPSVLAALLAAGTLPVTGQETKPTPAPALDLSELELLELLCTPVSGASKREQRLIDSPQAIEVITGEEIRALGIYRIQDALKLMTSIDLLEVDQGYSVIGMRGVMQDGQPRTVQVLVDGVAMYSAEAGPIDISDLPVPIDLIDKVEVVRGPSSTLYGANAVCGVIAITTKQAPKGLSGDLRASKANLNTFRSSLGAMFGTEHVSVTAGYSGHSAGTSGFKTRFLGLPDQRWYVDAPRSAYGSNPYLGSDAAHGFQGMARAQFQYKDTTIWASAGQSGKTYSGEGYFDYRMDQRTTFQGGWRQAWTRDFTTQVRVHKLEMENTLSPSSYLATVLGDPGFLAPYPFDANDVVQAELQANWTVNANIFLVFGADTRKMTSKKAPFIGLKKDLEESASGGFLTLDWRMKPSLALSLGVRAENESLGGSRTSPRLAVVWNPTPGSALRAGYYTSTRSPQMMEARVDFSYWRGTFWNGTAETSNGAPPNIPLFFAIQPNSELKPEKTTNLELGYRQAIGPVALDLTLYEMKFSQLISQKDRAPFLQTGRIMVPLVPITYPASYVFPTRFENLGDATNRGVEVAATWVITKGWTAGFNGAWLNYRKDNPLPNDPLGAEFAYAVNHKQNLWLRFHAGKFTGAVAVQNVGATTAEALSANSSPRFEARPAYTQWHLNLGWEFLPGLSLSGYARNGAKDFTLQGASGPDRQTVFQAMRREIGATLWYRF